MEQDSEEHELLRSVALQNARAVLLARERAERELIQTKEALELQSQELAQQREWYRVTLSSIGDAVVTTDTEGNVSFLNPVAESMTGWKLAEAAGQPLEKIFRIINETTREPAPNPITTVLREGTIAALANHTALISKNGRETAIDDSAAPIRDRSGKISGAVMVFHDVTTRRRSDAALRDSENRKSAILSAALDAIITMDHHGNVTDFNPAAEKIFGLSRASALGRSLAELIIPERYRERHEQGLARFLATGEGPVLGKRMEMPALRSNGEEFPTELSISLIPGVEPMFTATVRDLTERKQVEESLRKSEQFNRTIIESSRDCIKTLTLDGALLWMNEGGQKTLCIEDLNQLIGKSWIDFWHEKDQPAAKAAVQNAAQGGTGKFVGSFPVNGEAKWWNVVLSPILDPAGKPEKLLAVSRDVSERIAVELQLRASEKQLLDLANSIPQLAWMANPDGEIFWYNQRWYDYTGTTLEQMRGWGWQKVHDPKILPHVIDLWQESLRTGMPFEMEFPLLGADGVFRWFLTRVNPLRDADAKVIRWFGTNTDVDKVKKTEEALAQAQRQLNRYTEDLEHTVTARTAALRETIGELEAFSYAISHDMRAPLRAMQSFATALEEDCAAALDDVGKDYLRRISTAARRMDRLIQDVLTYSRVTRKDLPLTAIDSGKLLKDILESYLDFQPPSAEVRLEGAFPSVLAAEAILTQCFSNFLGNAVKFVRPGVKPKVRISAQKSSDGETARISFRDNGLGIEKRSQERIFGIFQRLHPDYEGTGIGLAIVKKGAERMGGTVGLESAPGEGSTFWIELRTVNTNAEFSPPPPEPASGERTLSTRTMPPGTPH